MNEDIIIYIFSFLTKEENIKLQILSKLTYSLIELCNLKLYDFKFKIYDIIKQNQDIDHLFFEKVRLNDIISIKYIISQGLICCDLLLSALIIADNKGYKKLCELLIKKGALSYKNEFVYCDLRYKYEGNTNCINNCNSTSNNVCSFNNYAFENCTSLSSITIPDYTTIISTIEV